MIAALALLLGCQLAGEVVVRTAGLPVPGPVLGLALLVTLFALRPALVETLRPTASPILANLSLLFIPAGVGVVANLDILSEDTAAVAAVLILSTLLSMGVTVGTFLAVRALVERGR